MPARLAVDPALAHRLTDQRLATDADFFAHLRLPGRADAGLRAALARGDGDGGVAIVAAHFRNRRAPRWPFYLHGSPWPEINGRGAVLAKADDLLRGRLKSAWPPFAVVELGDGSPAAWSAAAAHAGTSCSRHTFCTDLSTAFALTGEVAYLRAAVRLARSHVEAHPFVLEPGFAEDHDRYFGGGPNNSGDCLHRVQRWLDLLYAGALHAPGALSDADLVWLVKQCWFYAMQYDRLLGDELRRDNHHLTDHGQAPMLFGALFPEFAGAARRVAAARAAIRHHFEANLLADDAYAEHCTKYQYHILYMFAAPWAQARANRIRLFSARQERRFAAWFAFFAHLARPDGILAEFGDEYGGSLAQVFARLAAPAISPELAALGRALGYEPGIESAIDAAELGRRFAGWDGSPPRMGLGPWYGGPAARVARRAPPPAGLRTWPHAGFSSMRSAWTRDADFLAVAHYADSIAHGHTHWDMLAFVLHSGGRTLIGDPGTWLYTHPGIWEGPDARETRGYSYAVDAHNCLVVDDDTLKPLRALGHPCSWGGQPPRHGVGLRQGGGAIEVLELWHDAYAPIRHHRFVVHVRGVGFVFVDRLRRDGLDLRPHQYAQRFHAQGDVEPSTSAPAPGSALRLAADGGAVWLVPGAETANDWRAWQDRRLVDVYGVPGERVRGGPWVFELNRRIEGPAVFLTALITGGDAPEPRCRSLGGPAQLSGFRQHDALAADAFDLGPRGTLLVASCPFGCALASDALSTDAELAVALIEPNGRVASWAMARGTRLAVGGAALLRGRGRREWVAG